MTLPARPPKNVRMLLHAVMPPITTPFRDDDVDVAGLRSNIEQWGRTGLSGLVALGTNGEAAQLDDDESDLVIATTREHAPAGFSVIAGTARESTTGTIKATRRAAALGVDAVLVRTPSFFKKEMTSEALIRHYRAVAEASPVPVILYNYPNVTGINLHPDTVAVLAEHPNIIGMKESGGDLAQIAALVDQTPDTFRIVVGAAPSFYPSLCVGASGGILALACVAPDACVRLFRLVEAGRHDEARALQRRITPLARLIGGRHGVPGLKAAMDLAGYVGGSPRPPLAPVPPAVVEALRCEIERLARQEVA